MKKIEMFLMSITLLLAVPFLSYIVVFILFWLADKFSLEPSLAFSFFFLFPVFIIAVFNSELSRYLLLSLTSLAMSLAMLAWLWRQNSHIWQQKRFYPLLLALSSVLLFPLFTQYYPAVQAKSQAELRLVESPNLLMGVVRTSMAIAEVTDCIYEPLGWLNNETLIYRKWCDGYYDAPPYPIWHAEQPSAPLAYHLNTQQSTIFTGEVSQLERVTCIYSKCVRPLLSQDYVHATPPRYPLSFKEAVISPDQKWIAFVAEHVYGPEDLLLISTASE
jgi:hypothetical protein